jgi:hypothetical protein
MDELTPRARSKDRRISALSERDHDHQSIADFLLGSLDTLIRRHRSLALCEGPHSGLHAELIVSEVAHELALAQNALYGSSQRRRAS